MSVPKISYRTQVLFCILEFQEEYGHGIGFNQLVERCGLERKIVSMSHDSLYDMGLVNDIMHFDEKSKTYSKVMEITKGSIDFVRNSREKIKEELNATNRSR